MSLKVLAPIKNWVFLKLYDGGHAGPMMERFWFEQARLPWSSFLDSRGC